MTGQPVERLLPSHLKMRHLVLIAEMGKHGSILHASRAMSITQPAASKLLLEAERILGVQLFERQSRGVVPTPSGAVLIRRAGAALMAMHRAHDEVQQMFAGSSGQVHVGGVLTAASVLIADAVNLLRSRRRGVRVSISVDTSRALVEQLCSGALDVVVGRILDSAMLDDLNFEPIAAEPHSIVCRSGHPLLGRYDLTLPELVQQNWILPPKGSLLRERLSVMFATQGLSMPKESVETSALSVITNLLARSDMVVAMPSELMRPFIATGQLAVLPCDTGLDMDVYGIITRRGRRLAPGVQAMIDSMREVAAKRYKRSDAVRKSV